MRFLAYLVDSLLLGAVFVPLGFALGIVMAANADSGDAATTAFIQIVNMGVNVVSLVVGWLYQSLLESSSWQGTVGKKLLGLRVTDMDGNRIGFGKATGRYFGEILSGMICFVGFIMALPRNNRGCTICWQGHSWLPAARPASRIANRRCRRILDSAAALSA
jgi:uncharacterized RDD family membrane protein YckC